MSGPTFPVIEIFGPTIQGEGPEAGLPTHFIRFGGCDYRCTWCDSLYAVDPEQVRTNAEKLTVDQIIARLEALPGEPGRVVLSGGNPALLELELLRFALQDEIGYHVAVETQGSKWKPWLARVDRLVVSPKPPSSGMVDPIRARMFHDFYRELAISGALGRASCKIVVDDAADLDWAKRLWDYHPFTDRHLSVCTPQNPEEWREEGNALGGPGTWSLQQEVGDRYRWLCEQVAADPALAGVRVLPQLHVVAWGAKRGV